MPLPRSSMPPSTAAHSAAAEKLDAARVKAMVDDIWEARLQTGDPLDNLLHKAEVGALAVPIVEGNSRGNKGTMGGAFSSAQIGDLCRARPSKDQLHRADLGWFCKSTVVQCGFWPSCRRAELLRSTRGANTGALA